MNRTLVLFTALLTCAAAQASWYWPFGGDASARKQPRISELLADATEMIDRASDYSDEGQVDKAVAEYRRALAELDRVEITNPDLVETAEFATVRNKRAYVTAAVDSLLLKQARQNAKAVAVTDTTELEKRYARLKGRELPDEKKLEIAEKAIEENEQGKVVAAATQPAADEAAAPSKTRRRIDALLAKDPKNRRARLMSASEDLCVRNFDAAQATLKELLDERPNDAAALNMRAAVEVAMGALKEAERTLDQSIQSNPRSYYAYYNLARLILQTRGAEGREAARRYYEAGRAVGGPADDSLEALLQ